LAKQFKDLFFPQHLDITDDDLAYVVDYFTKLSNKPREKISILVYDPILDSLIHFLLEKRIPSLAIKYKELFLPQHLDVTDDDLQYMVDYFTKLSKKRGASSDDSDLTEKKVKSLNSETKNPKIEPTTSAVPSASTESSSESDNTSEDDDDDTPVIITPVKKPPAPVVDLSSDGSESSSGSSSSDSDEETHPYPQTQSPPLPVPVPASSASPHRNKASSSSPHRNKASSSSPHRRNASNESPHRNKASSSSPHRSKALNRSPDPFSLRKVWDRNALHPNEVDKKSRRPPHKNHPKEKQRNVRHTDKTGETHSKDEKTTYYGKTTYYHYSEDKPEPADSTSYAKVDTFFERLMGPPTSSSSPKVTKNGRGPSSSIKVTASTSKRAKTVSPAAPPPPKVCKYGTDCKGRKIGDCRDIHRSSYNDDGDGRRICKYGGDCRKMLWCTFEHPM